MPVPSVGTAALTKPPPQQDTVPSRLLQPSGPLKGNLSRARTGLWTRAHPYPGLGGCVRRVPPPPALSQEAPGKPGTLLRALTREGTFPFSAGRFPPQHILGKTFNHTQKYKDSAREHSQCQHPDSSISVCFCGFITCPLSTPLFTHLGPPPPPSMPFTVMCDFSPSSPWTSSETHFSSSSGNRPPSCWLCWVDNVCETHALETSAPGNRSSVMIFKNMMVKSHM